MREVRLSFLHPGRVWRRFRRPRNRSAVNDPTVAVDDNVQIIVNEMLRLRLHSVLDEVMDQQDSKPVVQKELKNKLGRAISDAIDDHASAAKPSTNTVPLLPSPPGEDDSTESAFERLHRLLQDIFGTGGSRFKSESVRVKDLFGRLIPTLVEVVMESASDPENRRKVQRQIEGVLGQYMSPRLVHAVMTVVMKMVEKAADEYQNRDKSN